MKRVLFVSYNSLIEPLGPTQILPYVLGLSGAFELSVLSFEKPVRTTEEDRRDTAATMSRLQEAGVEWMRLRYHKRPSLPATLFDISCGVLRVLREHRKKPFDLLHARAYVASAIACGVKQLTGVPFLFDQRGLQAEEYVDAGLWENGNLAFRLTKRVEQWILREADGIVTLTEAVRPMLCQFPGLSRRKVLPPWKVIPTCVDLEHFAFDPVERERIRASLKVGDRPVLLYSGSIGTFYLMDEMLDFFQVARAQWPGLFFLALVNRSPDVVGRAFAARGVPPGDFAVRWATHAEMPGYLSASDAAISLIRPSVSKLSSSPTKYGEYLSCGLPLLASADVGDVNSLLGGSDVGVLISEYSTDGYQRATERLRGLLVDGIRQRCRSVAEREFSLDDRALPAYRDLYDRILEGQVE